MSEDKLNNLNMSNEEWHDLYAQTIVLTNKHANKQTQLKALRNGNTQTNKKISSNTQYQSSKSQKLDSYNGEDNQNGGSHEKVNIKIGKLIQKKRLEKKLTQKQLGNLLNTKENIIKDIEAGKAIKDNQLLGKIKRKLNITKQEIKQL